MRSVAATANHEQRTWLLPRFGGKHDDGAADGDWHPANKLTTSAGYRHVCLLALALAKGGMRPGEKYVGRALLQNNMNLLAAEEHCRYILKRSTGAEHVKPEYKSDLPVTIAVVCASLPLFWGGQTAPTGSMPLDFTNPDVVAWQVANQTGRAASLGYDAVAFDNMCAPVGAVCVSGVSCCSHCAALSAAQLWC